MCPPMPADRHDAGWSGLRWADETIRASQAPRSTDDSAACEEWGWEPSYVMAAVTADMLELTGPAGGRET